jgi:hypothetical protein
VPWRHPFFTPGTLVQFIIKIKPPVAIQSIFSSNRTPLTMKNSSARKVVPIFSGMTGFSFTEPV